jgi:hypothetical protein
LGPTVGRFCLGDERTGARRTGDRSTKGAMSALFVYKRLGEVVEAAFKDALLRPRVG